MSDKGLLTTGSQTSQNGSRPTAASGLTTFQDLRREIDQMFERFFDRDPFQGFNLPTRLKGFDPRPTADVTEKSDAYEITAELPGISEKDVSVTFEDGVLTIAGEKKAEKTQDTKDVYVSERCYGAFKRAFVLPNDADDQKIDAKVGHGVLKVAIGRTKNPKTNGRKIAIQASLPLNPKRALISPGAVRSSQVVAPIFFPRDASPQEKDAQNVGADLRDL